MGSKLRWYWWIGLIVLGLVAAGLIWSGYASYRVRSAQGIPLTGNEKKLPPGIVDDSRTTRLDPTQVTVGERIAAAVGVAATGNTFVDFGVYDRRTKNAASNDPVWAASHNQQLAHYGVCWFDLLSPPADEATVRSLPPTDGVSGVTSDYCR